LIATTLRFPYEVRDWADYFGDIPELKLPKEMLQLAEHILETKTGDFEPGNFRDRYEDAVVEMIQRKRAGMPAPTAAPASRGPNVVSLMDPLKRSLAAEETKAPAIEEGQREMLLPIAGKAASKGNAKEAARTSPRQRKAG
jgi:DNA end-binding protein Ku